MFKFHKGLNCLTLQATGSLYIVNAREEVFIMNRTIEWAEEHKLECVRFDGNLYIHTETELPAIRVTGKEAALIRKRFLTHKLVQQRDTMRGERMRRSHELET